MKLYTLILLLMAVLVSGQARGEPSPLQKKPQLVAVAKLLAKGRYPAVISLSRDALRRQPTAAPMRALLGIALARSGQLAEALPHLESSAGVMAYVELGGLGAHADALRAAGQGQRAWQVRRQRIVPDLTSRARVQTLCQGVDDLLAAGDTAGAIALGEAAVAELPSSPAAHAFLTTALLSGGHVVDAGFHHWRSRSISGRRLARSLVNEAWLAEEHADLVAALRAWDALRVMRRTDVRIVAWQAAWLRRVGLQADVPGVIDAPAWRSHQSPELFAERVRSHQYLGQLEQAEQALTRLVSMFPDHPQARELLAESQR